MLVDERQQPLVPPVLQVFVEQVVPVMLVQVVYRLLLKLVDERQQPKVFVALTYEGQ
jgi:hypothetical protein